MDTDRLWPPVRRLFGGDSMNVYRWLAAYVALCAGGLALLTLGVVLA